MGDSVPSSHLGLDGCSSFDSTSHLGLKAIPNYGREVFGTWELSRAFGAEKVKMYEQLLALKNGGRDEDSF